MLIPRLALVPHVPTLLVDQHRGHRTAMIEALEALGGRLRAAEPEAVVIVSGRWETDGPFVVDAGRRHPTLTDYYGFGVEVRYDCDGHPALARALAAAGQKERVRVAAGTRGVDSGVTVPLHFLFPRHDVRVVPLSVAGQPRARCRAWGAVLGRTLAAWPGRVVFLVGGVLARNQHAWNLDREVPEATAYDERALECLARGAWDELWEAPPGMVRRAQPEAGLRHLAILRGALGEDRAGRVLAHEPGHGMGAALVEFDLTPADEAGPPTETAPDPGA